MEPDDAFPPASLDEALDRNPEANKYLERIIERSNELGRRPSWKAISDALRQRGVTVGASENPIKRVYRQRGGWDG